MMPAHRPPAGHPLSEQRVELTARPPADNGGYVRLRLPRTRRRVRSFPRDR